MYVISTKDTQMFRIKKEYVGQEPIYFALSDPYEKETLLCRYLTPTEKAADFKKIAYLTDTEKENSGKPCLMLSEVPSIENADAAVASYRRARPVTKQKGCS